MEKTATDSQILKLSVNLWLKYTTVKFDLAVNSIVLG